MTYEFWLDSILNPFNHFSLKFINKYYYFPFRTFLFQKRSKCAETLGNVRVWVGSLMVCDFYPILVSR